MAQAAGRDRWNHTAALLALIANCHRDPKKSRAFRTREFHPHFAQSKRRSAGMPDRVGVSVLKQIFVDRPRDC